MSATMKYEASPVSYVVKERPLGRAGDMSPRDQRFDNASDALDEISELLADYLRNEIELAAELGGGELLSRFAADTAESYIYASQSLVVAGTLLRNNTLRDFTPWVFDDGRVTIELRVV